ncbi:hypothetical protein [Fretibacter rubidus]|uniref:hypothetical protein n=1 Tax=Fretibacter rubidus TaxID=570162 RepID=UPI00352A79DB
MSLNSGTDLSYIERRVVKAFYNYSEGDYESCALQLFPALDNTAKRRFGGGVGKRIKSFLSESSPMITFIATSNIMTLKIGVKPMLDILYDQVRTSIVHEGRVDANFTWTTDGSMRLSEDGANAMPHDFLFGMLISVLTAPENASLRSLNKSEYLTFTHIPRQPLPRRKFWLSHLWGAEDYLYAEISLAMNKVVHRAALGS